MNKKFLILVSLITLVAGAWFLWFDYSFTIFGEHEFGNTKIFEVVKVLHVAIVLIILGAVGLIKAIRKK